MKIHKYCKQIILYNNRLALGYENMLSFNYGYIKSLFCNKLISRAEYNKLIKVYAYDNSTEDSLLYINSKGNIGKLCN